MSLVIEPDAPVKPPSVDINVNDSLSAGAIVGICLGILVLFLFLGACLLLLRLYWARRAKANATLPNGANQATAVNGDGTKQVGVSSAKGEHHHKRKKSSRRKLLVLKRRSSFQSAAAASGRRPLSSPFSGHRGGSERSLKPSSAGSRKSSGAFSRKSSAPSKRASRLSKKGSLGLSKKGSQASRKASKASKKSAKSSLKHSFGFKKGPQGFTVTPNGLKAPLPLKKQAPDGALQIL